MKTPHLDIEINNLENLSLTKNLTGLAKDALKEYKAIKEFIKGNLQKETNKRYFIVSYSGKINSNIFVGFADISTDGCFLNLKTTVRHIKEQQGLKECVITNIMEISEQDFNDWIN
jgi:hypothetical protein